MVLEVQTGSETSTVQVNSPGVKEIRRWREVQSAKNRLVWSEPQPSITTVALLINFYLEKINSRETQINKHLSEQQTVSSSQQIK